MNTQQYITLSGRSMHLGPGHFAALHGWMVIVLLPVFCTCMVGNTSAVYQRRAC